MADPTDISQFIVEAAPDAGVDQLSQGIVEVAASTGPDRLSQFIGEVAPTTGIDRLSQLVAEIAATTGRDQISQLTIELLRGPEVVPPAETPTEVFTFDAGLGLDYFLALQPSDSGIEGRDKVVKAVRVTGKVNSGFVKIYAYGPVQNVDVDQIEDGVGFKTYVLLADSTQVQQSKRYQVNVPNAMMHLVRIEGRWDGTGERDRIDEIFYEVAQQGIRR